MPKESHWLISAFHAELSQLQEMQGGAFGVLAAGSRTIAEAEATESVEMKGLAMKNYVLPAIFAAAVLSSAPAAANSATENPMRARRPSRD